MICPACYLESPQNARCCDCGHEFVSGSKPNESPVASSQPPGSWCPKCKTFNPATNQFCGKCGSPVNQMAAQKSAGILAPLITVLVVLLVGIWIFSPREPGTVPRRPATSPSPARVSASPQVALLSANGHESSSFHIVEGEVQNITNQRLENIMAVASWYTRDGTFITSEDTLIDYNPTLPGQKSPFKVISTTNPEMARYTVEFKEWMGGTVPWEDRRNK